MTNYSSSAFSRSIVILVVFVECPVAGARATSCSPLPTGAASELPRAGAALLYTLAPTLPKHEHEANYAFWAVQPKRLWLRHQRRVRLDSRLTTKDICEEVVKPLTKPWQCTIVDAIAKERLQLGKGWGIGRAGVFASHAWKYRFEDFVGALRADDGYMCGSVSFQDMHMYTRTCVDGGTYGLRYIGSFCACP